MYDRWFYTRHTSYFKLHVRWLPLLTQVVELSQLHGFISLPPSCNLNYLGYIIIYAQFVFIIH